MYSRWLPIAVLVLLGVPRAGSAQVTDELVRQRLETELEVRLEALDARLDSLGAPEDEGRDVVEPWRVDTASVGPFVVVARKEQAAVLVRDVARALAALESELGAVGELRPSPVLRLVLSGTGSRERPRPGEWSGGPWSRVPGEPPQLRRTVLAQTLTEAVSERMPAAVREWSDGRPLPLDVEWTAVRSDFLASGGPRAVECVEEGGAGCVAALGLAPEAASRSGAGSRPGELRGDDLSARTRVRGSLLAFVLRRDPAALDRLLTTDDDVGVVAALERAAGAPMLEIVADWRARLVDAGPLPDLPRTLASSLVWLVLFTGFAARSTRWRLG